jgi:DHA1 family bicyclomycin/chloramphenicol resistance-like MFS transporter
MPVSSKIIESRTADYGGKHHLTVIAALLSMIGPFTIDAYLPSFPDIETTFNISRAMLTQSLAIYLFAFALSTLFWGPLADRIGRRLVILSSLSLYVLASAGCALADQSTSFILLRMLQGFAASGGFIAGRAMIRDAHDAASAHRAMAQVTLLFALAPAVAPVLGAWLHDHFGWRSVFWFLTGFGILLILLVAFIKETLADEHRQSFHPLSVIRVYTRTLRHRQFLRMILSLSFAFAGLFLYIAGAPTIIYDFLGLGIDDFGWQFIPMVGGLMLGAFVSSRLVHRLSSTRIVIAGFSVIALAVLLNLLQVALLKASVLSIIGPLVIYAFGIAMIMPAITIQTLDCFPKNRGAATSMQGFFQMLINAGVASVAVPMLHTRNQFFVLGQLAFLLIALALWYFARPAAVSKTP